MGKYSVQTGRRGFLKAALAAGTAPLILTPRKSAAQVPPLLPSKATIPWVEELPREIPPVSPLETLSPAPTLDANTANGEVGRAMHQRFAELGGETADLYEVTVKENPRWSFNPNYPAQPIWGFAPTGPNGTVGDAVTPGPTFRARYGRPIICRFRNELPVDHVGFGTPEISMHLHNLHTPSESDGFPGDFWSATRAGPTLAGQGQFKDHFYPNAYAGIDAFGRDERGVFGDSREALGTLWYHDHTMDFTAPNVYRGLAGFYLIHDYLDSGDEHDPNPAALRLPSGNYDYPLMFNDKVFDQDGVLLWDQLSPEGLLGDKITVNGKIEPVLRVERRKYRFRLLNGGPSRFYELYLQNSARNAVFPFTYIANDGNLLQNPLLNQFRVRLGVAERGDIVVDFARFPVGTELYVVNQLQQLETRGPDNVRAPGTRLLKIIVDRNPAQPDVSRVPTFLRALPTMPTSFAGVPVRQWVFARSGGLWTVNDELFQVGLPRATPTKGSAEIWELVNPEDGWHHPIHIHLEEGRIIGKTVNGINAPVPLHERGRKDVYVLGKSEALRVYLRFRDFTGKYPMHCHNTIHEDHSMMVRWDIV
jgi:FtsP/CotA-like multicopper oxidase with cupredoxin domain